METDQGLRQCQELTNIREMEEVELIGLGTQGVGEHRLSGLQREWLSAVTEV